MKLVTCTLVPKELFTRPEDYTTPDNACKRLTSLVLESVTALPEQYRTGFVQRKTFTAEIKDAGVTKKVQVGAGYSNFETWDDTNTAQLIVDFRAESGLCIGNGPRAGPKTPWVCLPQVGVHLTYGNKTEASKVLKTYERLFAIGCEEITDQPIIKKIENTEVVREGNRAIGEFYGKDPAIVLISTGCVFISPESALEELVSQS